MFLLSEKRENIFKTSISEVEIFGNNCVANNEHIFISDVNPHHHALGSLLAVAVEPQAGLDELQAF